MCKIRTLFSCRYQVTEETKDKLFPAVTAPAESVDDESLKKESVRLKSFEGKWNYSEKPSPRKLAAAGFWYLGDCSVL